MSISYVRPLTTLGRRGARAGDAHRIALYEHAREVLGAAGYRQVTMRMFARGAAVASAYRAERDPMIGLGPGARSYTRGLHYASE